MKNVVEDGQIVFLHNHYDAKHLDSVVADMRVLGAPTIHVLDLGFDGLYQALEGSHRLRACAILDITPILIVVDETTTASSLNLDSDCEDITELGDWENEFILIENGCIQE